MCNIIQHTVYQKTSVDMFCTELVRLKTDQVNAYGAPPPHTHTHKYIFVTSVTINPSPYSSPKHLLFAKIIDIAYAQCLIRSCVFRIPVTDMSSLNNMIDTRLDVLTAMIIRLPVGGS